jgi:hypothetical protein
MLAMDVNDDAHCLYVRGVFTSFASMLAPTMVACEFRSLHPLPNHSQTSFESSIRAPGAPCINGSTGITRHKKRNDPCGLNPRLPICALASK